MASAASHVRGGWRKLGLAAQFAIAATLVIGLGTGVLAWWAGRHMERGVIEHAVANAVLHLDAFIEPHVQELAHGSVLAPQSKEALRRLSAHAYQDRALLGVRIWQPGGHLVFSTLSGDDRGVTVTPPAVLESREVTDRLDYIRSAGTDTSQPILKIYAPLHRTGSLEILAIAELHEINHALSGSISALRWRTAGAFAVFSAVMIGLLSGIVRRGGRIISEQERGLSERVEELSRLADSNRTLQKRLVEANRRSVETNERHLRRIGADLHDGPLQLIALALLRIDSLPRSAQPETDERPDSELETIESALRDAIREIRSVCSGLSLPKFDGLGLAQVICFAAMNHERRSRSTVVLELDEALPKVADTLLQACVYRFVQEGLNNAFRHAGGRGQKVTARMEDQALVLSVIDSGPGIDSRINIYERGLGLAGLRERIETLGGHIRINSAPDQGTSLTAVVGLTAQPMPETLTWHEPVAHG